VGGVDTAEALRTILAGAHSLRATFSQRAAPTTAWLRARTDWACGLASVDRFDDLAAVLAELLPGLEAAVRTVPAAEQPDVYELMAVAYQSCAAALARLGEPDAAWVAADRAMAAAEQAGNLLLVAASAHRLASVFLAAQRCAMADELARTTIEALTGLVALGDPEAVALCGGLALLRASVAAKAGRQDTAYDQLARARHLAARLGQQAAGSVPEFSREYVALYDIAVSVNLGDAGHALRVAATLDPAGLSPVRRAQMLVNVARAHALRGQLDPAARALLQAEAAGPGYLRDSDRVRELIAALLKLCDPPPAALTDLAARLAAPALDA
jgi:hypothetical protein